MNMSEETIRNLIVLLFLSIAFPAITAYVMKSVLSGVAIGLIMAIIIFTIFWYLEKRF